METETDLEMWWQDFVRSLRRRGRSERTLRIYRQSFEYFWSFAEGQGIGDPAEVDRSLINAWTEHEQAKGISAQSVSLRWRNLRPFWSWWALETESANPFAGADVPSVQEEPPDVASLDDVRALVQACRGRNFAGRRDEAIIRVLFDTGCRLGELLGLTTDDWDRRQDFLTLRGKTGLRVVALSASTGEALARYLRARAKHPQASGTDVAGLWIGRKGVMRAPGIYQMLNRRCRQAGIAHVHPHQLRHTWAHEFRVAGGSEGDLLYAAGWKSTVMAHRYGASAAASRSREAQRGLGLGDRL